MSHAVPGLPVRFIASFSLLALLACTDKNGGEDTGGGTGTLEGGDLLVSFVAPVSGTVFTDDVSITVEISVVDPEGGSVEGVELAWSGLALDGLDLPGSTDSTGAAGLSLSDLDLGLHSLAVLARRPTDGASGLGSTAFEVVSPDADNDGYIDELWGGDDCDDEDPTINPAAEEFCDGQDNDCNGEIDGADATDVKTWYEDLDADGYGVTDLVIVSCQEPKDYVLLSGDCDDDNDQVHPGQAEICDEIDNDCDGLTDDEDPGLQTAGATVWYPDADADGYGDYSDFALACVAPEGWIAEGGDCDDGDAEINPGADELCDGRDNNCMDGVDEEGAVDAPTWYADDDEDDWGVEDDTVQACDEPEGHAAAFGDCDDADDSVNPDAIEICNDGIDNDCDATWSGCLGDLLGTGLQLLGEETLDGAAYGMASAGDIDGDGIDDVVVGARDADGDEDEAGRAYLVLGPVEAIVDLADADTILLGEDDDAHAGRKISAGLDATGDGVTDILIGAPGATVWGNQEGLVRLVSGDDALDGGTQRLAEAWHTFVGEATFGYLGVGATLVDMDEDGDGDVLIGATHVDAGGSNAGAVYFYAGPFAAGETDLRDGDWDARIVGAEGGDNIGGNLEGRGDYDGDGVRDLAIGVPLSSAGGSSAGAVALLSGTPAGSMDLADADATVVGDGAGYTLGSALAWAGDVDGDGYDDLFMGAPNDDSGGSSAGAAYLVAGSGDLATLDGAGASTLALATLIGADSGGQLGQALAADGDHDGDGELDLLVGAPAGGPTGDGAVLLFLGPIGGSLTSLDAAATWAGDASTGGVGQEVAFGGSVAGGDTDAILVGARTADLSGADAGALLLVAETGL